MENPGESFWKKPSLGEKLNGEYVKTFSVRDPAIFGKDGRKKTESSRSKYNFLKTLMILS